MRGGTRPSPRIASILVSNPITEQAVTAAATAAGVTVAPIGRFCISPVAARGVVMGFSGVRPPEIVQGVRTLARAIDGFAA